MFFGYVLKLITGFTDTSEPDNFPILFGFDASGKSLSCSEIFQLLEIWNEM